MTSTKNRAVTRVVAAAAIAVGLAGGSYGIANAASGSGSAVTQWSGNGGHPNRSAPSAGNPWGGQRSDEKPLTGDTAAKVKQLALAKVGSGTIVRVETDADGHAAYEAHVVKKDGSRVTVYVDKQLNVVGVETR
jgi:hypothetical protein